MWGSLAKECTLCTREPRPTAPRCAALRPLPRVDWRLDNLTEFKRSDVDPPPLDARGLEGYKGSPLNVFMLRGTADVRAAYNKWVGLVKLTPAKWVELF